MKKYMSVRNNATAVLVGEHEGGVTLRLESGEEKAVTASTLKRWWKLVEEAVTEPAEEIPETVEPVIVEEPAETPVVEEAVKPKAKKDKPAKVVDEASTNQLRELVERLATERGTEVFQINLSNFKSLKVDGKMYMALTFSKKGVTLWMRSKAVSHLTAYKAINHMFDARVSFNEVNKANTTLITKLIDASIEYQKTKESGKKTK